MNQQIQETEGTDGDELLAQLSTLAQEAIERDFPRLEKLHATSKLSEPKVLAAELTKTVVPVLADHIKLSTQLVTEHQQGIVELEDFAYQNTPRALNIVVGALRAKGLLTDSDAKQIVKLIGEGSDEDSLLSRADADIILSCLMSFKTLATQIASSKEEKEAADARASLEAIDRAVARVMEISVPAEPEEDEADDDDEEDDDEDDESDEA